jgi:hypothetical protein
VAAAAPADLAGLVDRLALSLSKGHCCATTAPDATTCTRRSSSTPCPEPVEGCRETGGRSGQPGARGGAARLS